MRGWLYRRGADGLDAWTREASGLLEKWQAWTDSPFALAFA